MKLLAHNDLAGAARVGEGMALKITRNGRRIMYLAHENPPMDLTIVDVSDPREPEVVWQRTLPHNQVRSNSLVLAGDLLLVAYQVRNKGDKPAGVQIFDVSNPLQPKEVSFFDTSGPHSQGVHLVTCNDGRYMHIATGAADFEPNHPRDHQFYMIVDLADPTRPREVGRWWLPGTRKGDSETLERHKPPSLDFAFRVHHALSYPGRPDRAYLGYIDGGAIVLDISDKGHPKMISRLDYHPPMPGMTHTVMPIFERGLIIMSDEAHGAGFMPPGMDEGFDWPKLYWIVDAREETNPVIISTAPKPADFEELRRVGGRIGAHNFHENEPEPGSAQLKNTLATTWFTAGIRLYDIRDPFRPEEIAAFIPETPPGQRGSRISDVFVDDRGIVYAGDREAGGLYTLEYTGQQPLD
ncbi:MAG: hypothetical protein IT307_07375 [Chloroflexi bacterium]|nr:hypothetical protein [Chloroflexota bacterium]